MKKMKNSDINYFGKIPYDWSLTKIKYIVEEEVATGAGEEAQEKTPNSIRYIRISDFDKNGNINDDLAAYIPRIKGIRFSIID